MAMMGDVVRLAVDALLRVLARRKSEKLAMSEAARELGVRNAEAIRFAHRLVVETLRHLNLLDELVKMALGDEIAFPELSGRVRAFLRLLAYRAAIEEASTRELTSFVRAARETLGRGRLRPVELYLGRIVLLRPEDVLASKSGDERLALELRVPTWLLRLLCRELGRPLALAFLRSCLRPQPSYVRVNTLKGPEERALAMLEEEGVEVEPVEGISYLYRVVEAGKPVIMTRAYREGLVYPQDKASCLAVQVAEPEPGMTVLDVCAAPGAKTTYMAQLMENRGLIVSVDFSDRRLRTWLELTARLGVKIARPVLADARYPLPTRLEADIVLLDLPCTSTGAFARAPSAKWRLTPRSARNMAKVQAKILSACAKHVRSGGSLIYVTCSLLVEENELVLERFLRTHPDFELEEARLRVGLPGLRGLRQAQRLYTHLHACDGYFIARLRRA